jgi:hypothetical protein
MMALRRLVFSGIVILGSAVSSSSFAEQVLYCADSNVIGFAWDDQGHAKESTFVQHRFKVTIGSNNERLITQTSEGVDQGHPRQFQCNEGIDAIVCRTVTGETPWLFAMSNEYYARAYLAGGPPNIKLDQKIFFGYGTCTRY